MVSIRPSRLRHPDGWHARWGGSRRENQGLAVVRTGQCNLPNVGSEIHEQGALLVENQYLAVFEVHYIVFNAMPQGARGGTWG